ncbi:hypothetical protein MKX41_30730 [Paenibacillus sp. FSL R5-0475]|uniref:hypothetical protein n=1 Tax=Paenibacillus sp. FSL R5-0475 TaxID=2921643 RepID=UPI0030F5BFBD
MTQVQMTDQQLNRELAELMGYEISVFEQKPTHPFPFNLVRGNWSARMYRKTEDEAWLDAPTYCTDPAASLEVQAKALELNYKAYIDHLDEFVNTDELTICSEPSYRAIASLLLASPRERAEAAYVTIQGEK